MSLKEPRQSTAAETATSGGLDVQVIRRRIWATLLDGAVLWIVVGVLTAAWGRKTAASSFDLTQLSAEDSVLWVPISALYYVLMEHFLGRTLGKMVTGIRVVNEATAGKPTIGQAAIRTLLRIVDGLFGYLVGFIAVLSSDRRRRLGDVAAKTLVVRA